MDNTIRLWDTNTGQLNYTLQGGHGLVAFAPDGKILASASQRGDGTIRLWDVNTGQLNYTFHGHKRGVELVVFAPDGKTLTSVGWDDAMRLWDVDTGQLKYALNITHADADAAFPSEDTFFGFFDVLAIVTIGESTALAPDGTTLARVNDMAGTVLLWDMDTGQLRNTLQGHTGGFLEHLSVAFAPDGTILASASAVDETVRLWDMDTGQLKYALQGHRGGVWGVAFAPDGKTIANVNHYGAILLWDVDTGQLRNTLQGGHVGSVTSVAFSPDGKTLASADSDGTILLWDMSPYITPSTPTAVELSPTLPTQTALLANYPNPFNPNTHIPYQLHAPAHVRLTIYDIRGALIREIDLGYRQAGQYLTSTSAAHWDGRDHRGQRVASGVYMYQLQAGPVVHGRKMLLVK